MKTSSLKGMFCGVGCWTVRLFVLSFLEKEAQVEEMTEVVEENMIEGV